MNSKKTPSRDPFTNNTPLIDPLELQSYIKENPLHEIALTSSLLGIVFGVSIVVTPFLKFKAIGIYMMTLCVFHFMEFFITAKYNTPKVTSSSFLINNGSEYLIAHFSAVVEAYIGTVLFPGFKSSWPWLQIIGLVLIIAGQITRSLAMMTLGRSFSHIVSVEKKDDHILVQSGIYSVSRHPSYVGFFYWALGTQLLLVNPLCFVGFGVALWTFFSRRIRFEEQHLVAFFGDDYVRYRTRTGTLLPFI